MNADNLTRLFPLPKLVLFPGAVQPLHIFEPRYREMMADALAGDGRIAMVLPKPGWEEDYAGAPAIHAVACVGKIVADQRLADGRFNILLRGLERIRIIEEVPTGKLYRTARTVPLHEEPCRDAVEEDFGRKFLRTLAVEWFRSQPEVRDRFLEVIDGDHTLGALVDLLAFSLSLEAEIKQTILEELNELHRVRLLVNAIGNPQRPFPPEFSAN
jgi:Lon protease-like protein